MTSTAMKISNNPQKQLNYSGLRLSNNNERKSSVDESSISPPPKNRFSNNNQQAMQDPSSFRLGHNISQVTNQSVMVVDQEQEYKMNNANLAKK